MRVGTLADSNLAARRLSVLHTAVYATPSYVERFGEPLHPDDLVHHRALAQTNHRSASTFAWTLGEGDGKPRDFRIEPVMVSNDPGTLRTVLLDGEGIMLTSDVMRSEEHTSELQSLMRISYAVFCLKKKKKK